MKFAREGYVVSAVPAAAALIAALLGAWPYAWGLLILATAALLFFRDPERTPPGDELWVVAPADGRVVAVDEISGGHRLYHAVDKRVAIFMSPLNVHVNRSPVDAVVEAVEHRSGSFKAAYSADASEANESNALLMKSRLGFSVVVVQIAGWLARRIRCWAGEGSSLARGERFGLIMFGSRVDVYLPACISVTVAVGDKVVAGESVIGRAQ